MAQSAKWSVIGAIVLTICILAAVPIMLRTVNRSEDGTEAKGSSTSVEERPDCIGQIPVDLPCLGGVEKPAPRKVTVVNVWAWWCEPCREELPVIQEFANLHPEYHVVGVHADAQAANGAAMLNDLGVDMPSYQDSNGTFAGTLGLPGVVPVTVILQEDGTTAAVEAKVFKDVRELERAVEESLQ